MSESKSDLALQDLGTAAVGLRDGASQLLHLGELARELVADEVAERVAEGRFYVSCVGQFERGQSTVIKVLIGAEVLPTESIPVRAVPAVIRLMKVTREPAQVAANLESIRNS